MSFFEIILSFSGHSQHGESKYVEIMERYCLILFCSTFILNTVIAVVPGYLPFQSSTVL